MRRRTPRTRSRRSRARRSRKQYSESVSDLIAAGLLQPDTVLQPLRKNVAQTSRVLADGRLELGSVAYTSLSGAAKAAAGTVAEAGWDFWGAPSGTGGVVALLKLRDLLREGNGAPAPDAKQVKPSIQLKPQAPSSKQPVLAPIAAARLELFPLTIFSDYRGAHIEAVVDEHGTIHLGSETYASPSTAAVAARTQPRTPEPEQL